MADEAFTSSATHPERDDGPARLRRRRRLYRVTSTVVVGIVVLGVADVFGPVLGVDSGTTTATSDDGIVLTVEYPELTRPALASPFSIEVVDAQGFDGPIEVAISRPWIEVWDENGMYPTPSAETGDDRWVVWEFDPPEGTRFRFFYDARLEPARQSRVAGAVELRDGETVLAAVDFATEVRP